MVGVIGNLRQSWSAYRKNFAVIAISVLISIIPSLLVTILGFFAVTDFSLSETSHMLKETYLSQESYILGEKQALPEKLYTGWFLFFVAVSGLLSVYFLAGFYGVCISALRGKANLSVFFESVSKRGITLVLSRILLFSVAICYLIAFLGIALAFAFVAAVVSTESILASEILFVILLFVFLLGALITLPFFMFISPSVVTGKGVIDAFRESIQIGRKSYWQTFSLILFIVVLVLAGVIVTFFNSVLGMAFSIIFVSPMITLLIASFYLERAARKAGELSPRLRKTESVRRSKK